MYCVCYVCGIQYRKKRPFNDRRVSHGVCDDCFPVEMGRIKGELALLGKQKTRENLLNDIPNAGWSRWP